MDHQGAPPPQRRSTMSSGSPQGGRERTRGDGTLDRADPWDGYRGYRGRSVRHAAMNAQRLLQRVI